MLILSGLTLQALLCDEKQTTKSVGIFLNDEFGRVPSGRAELRLQASSKQQSVTFPRLCCKSSLRSFSASIQAQAPLFHLALSLYHTFKNATNACTVLNSYCKLIYTAILFTKAALKLQNGGAEPILFSTLI